MQRDYDGRQPGEPARAAQAILGITRGPKPPLRLAQGSDAVAAIAAADSRKADELEAWRGSSVSTDFPGA